MFWKMHTEVVKRDRNYFVIVRRELRIFGVLVRAGQWYQYPNKFLSRLEALRFAVKAETNTK